MQPNQFQEWIDLQRQQTQALKRIAAALEQLAQGDPNAPKPAKYIRSIKEFPNFDWQSIGARVKLSDSYGVAVVQWQGNEYQRRSKDDDIWFNRKIGQKQDANGQTKSTYEVLIRFGRSARVRSIPDEIQELYS